MIYNNILETIGHTPIIRINKLAPDGVEMYVSSDPGVTFRSCPYCAAEAPVRISRIGDQFKVFVFQNAKFAKRFTRANGPGAPTE